MNGIIYKQKTSQKMLWYRAITKSKDRHSIVEFKIKDKKPFVISATATCTKVYGVSYDKKSKILVYKETQKISKKYKQISILKIFKDKDFGGAGKKSGGGADLTKITNQVNVIIVLTPLMLKVVK